MMSIPDAAPLAVGASTSLLLMRQGAEYVALELTAAVEAMELPTLVPLPGAAESLLGMTTVRGVALPVFAASLVLGVDGRGRGAGVLVIVREEDRYIGIVVDEVEDVIMADLAAMQQPMATMRGDGIVRGVVRSGDLLVAVLDARALVRFGARVRPAAS